MPSAVLFQLEDKTKATRETTSSATFFVNEKKNGTNGKCV